MENKIEISKELEDLIPLFLIETEKNIENLEKAIRNNDREQIKFISHRIKGSSGSYGFQQISELAKKIESLSIQESSLEDISNWFTRLKESFQNMEIIFVDKPL